ncbi:hypothetical protein QQF64_007186, partial [Cirrhinus molitorella]
KSAATLKLVRGENRLGKSVLCKPARRQHGFWLTAPFKEKYYPTTKALRTPARLTLEKR